MRREIGDRKGTAYSLKYLGNATEALGAYTTAEQHYQASLALFKEAGARASEGLSLCDLGRLWHHLGDDESACAYSQQAVRIFQDADDPLFQGEALTHLGHALVGLGRLAEARDAYQQAVDLRRAVGRVDLAMEGVAGLVRVSLAQRDLTQAQAQVEEILSYLETDTLDGTDEPCRIYLTCYRVLHANQDPRAQEILTTAYNLLQARAAKITDAETRRSYLENAAAHREIVSEFTNAVR
ncbi:MAG: tetratricopeptide repeat protein [Anaerolineae bacterium]